jgi:hypothetical protein
MAIITRTFRSLDEVCYARMSVSVTSQTIKDLNELLDNMDLETGRATAMDDRDREDIRHTRACISRCIEELRG